MLILKVLFLFLSIFWGILNLKMLKDDTMTLFDMFTFCAAITVFVYLQFWA